MRKKSVYQLILISVAVLVWAVFIAPVLLLAAEAPVNLGTTANFAVLAGSTVTNTGSTVISGSAGGDVGVSPGTSVTGFPPGTISNGTIHLNDAVAIKAQLDLVTAYNDAAGRTVTEDLTGQDLGGLTLKSGVYSFDSSAQLIGTLTLDAEGNPDAAFIFQIGSTLTTASYSSVNLINGAQYCRVFWQVGSSATLGTYSQFIGHIFAMDSITATTGATVQGQLLARTGAVTLDSNIITNGVCIAATPTPPEETTVEETTVEETTAEETTAEETTAEETTVEETTVEETTAEEKTVEETTAETENLIITSETIPLTETEASTQETPQLTDDEIPQTGSTSSSVIIGSTLLALAASLFYILRRKRA